jgi:hypothetical protein
MTGNSEKAKLEIVAATDEHAAALATFYAAVWNGQGSAADVVAARATAAQRNSAEPGRAPPMFLAVQNGRVLGHVATMPIRVWDGRTEMPAYWVRDLMILPEYRNGPLGFGLLKAMAGCVERSGALTIVPASRRLFEALGFEDQGVVPQFLRPLALGHILARLDVAGAGLEGPLRRAVPVLRFAQRTGAASLAGGLGSVLLRGAAALARRSAVGYRARRDWPSDLSAHLDGLWEAIRASTGTSVVRDGTYLLQKYGPPSSGGDYDWVGVWKGDSLRGVAILHAPLRDGNARLPGVSLATIEELVVSPQGPSCLALLGAVERHARSRGAHAVVARLSSAELRRPLAWQGYLRVPGTVHFLIRDVARTEPRLRGPLHGWWLSHGDG